MKNYMQWNVLHYSWDSVEHFTSDFIWRPGIHSVRFYSGTLELDIFLSDTAPEVLQNSEMIPIMFSGAVSNRGSKKGPFFSGRNIANKFSFPMIAIADPVLDSNSELSLGWYTGGFEAPLHQAIVELLCALNLSLSKELLLVGGSGGGFAALNISRSIPDIASVFVWNPQTDIYKYSERHVKKYLKSVFSFAHSTLSRADWIEYCRPRTDKFFSTDVLEGAVLRAPRKVLYLQNSSDWHYDVHLKPLWMKTESVALEHGLNVIDDEHLVLVHDFALGHEPLDPELIGHIIQGFVANGGSLTSKFTQEWFKQISFHYEEKRR